MRKQLFLTAVLAQLVFCPLAEAGDTALPNFHKVHDYLYRGGEPSSSGLTQLKQLGVTTLIDLRAPTKKALEEKKEAAALNLNYINLPMSDKPPTSKQVETFLDTVKQAQATSSGTKPDVVFVHCAHGSDRTGCMVGIWRVTQEGYSYKDAYSEMRKYYFTPKFTQLANAVKIRASK